jgi:hypothetical protein
MRNFVKYRARFSASILVYFLCLSVSGQLPMPDALFKGTVQEQINSIYDRTKVFEEYRAVREDMFQKLIGNLSDTIKQSSEKIRYLNISVQRLNHRIDSLTNHLQNTKQNLEETTAAKNSIRILGKDISKATYNAVMWIVVVGLAVLAVLLFLSFKRGLIISEQSRKELNDLRDEFQAYRKSAREAREKLSMDHFNELKKLKGPR